MKPNATHFLFVVAFACGGAALSGEEIRSPDGRLVTLLELTNGAPSLEVKYNGRAFLERSPLGLETSVGSCTSGLTATDSKVREINETYALPHGKVHEVNYRANELTCRFTNSTKDFQHVARPIRRNGVHQAHHRRW